MLESRLLTDMEEIRHLWGSCWTEESLFDHWGLRECFASMFRRRSLAVVVEDGRRVMGFLPLSWIEESACYGFFPGETWKGRTWLERNRIFLDGPATLDMLLENVPGPLSLRYLLAGEAGAPAHPAMELDELNYRCFPRDWGYSPDGYWRLFSGKSARRIGRELSRFDDYGVAFRHGRFDDLETMFALNKASHGEDSYFEDSRFMRSFLSLAEWLRDRGMLRVTAALVGGKVAAVDMGAVFKGVYTLLAGGTHREFPGVAKLINVHHVEWACSQRMDCVDFMCGDFGWKRRFHLSASPLYGLCSPVRPHCLQPELQPDRNELAHAF